ncbi:MAG: SRPBCC domain-containing protein [Acidobacteria bacterium]|nr:MAG: ATPase [Acidobacteria bacterium 13_2_20CM_58_27]PYT69234.1 MAG: SRPBCC domain-containing protein [Acidobacteriota bacterium]PYT83978.1 MAG: SRPBCC domain-containing protein [Acidobacteriota bacterium]
MTLTLPGIESLSLSVNEEIRVRASLDRTFKALLEQLGPHNETPDGTSMPMKLESWPGGRWFRDLGDGNGHFWGVVQAIKTPTLLEIAGPLFMSYPVANNVQYRLSEENGVTIIKFRHAGFGLITDEHKAGVVKGWAYIHENVRKRAETGRSKSAAIQ